MTTREAARSLRRYLGRASRAASLPLSYTITRDVTAFAAKRTFKSTSEWRRI